MTPTTVQKACLTPASGFDPVSLTGEAQRSESPSPVSLLDCAKALGFESVEAMEEHERFLKSDAYRIFKANVKACFSLSESEAEYRKHAYASGSGGENDHLFDPEQNGEESYR